MPRVVKHIPYAMIMALMLAVPAAAQTRVGNTAIGFNVDFNTFSVDTDAGSESKINFTGSGSLSQYISKNFALTFNIGSAVTPGVEAGTVNAITSLGIGGEFNFVSRQAKAVVPFVEAGFTANYDWNPVPETNNLTVSTGFQIGGGIKAFVRENASINTVYRFRSLSMDSDLGETTTFTSTNLSTGLQIYF